MYGAVKDGPCRLSSRTSSSIRSGETKSVMLNRYSTDAVARSQRVAFWRDAICSAYVGLDCERISSDGFEGRLISQTVGAVGVSDIKTSPYVVVRSKRRISKSSDDCFLLSVQRSGSAVIEQGDRTACLNPGDLALYDSSQPYRLRFDETLSQMVLKLPRPLIQGRLARPEAITATRVPGDFGVGRIVSTFLLAMSRNLEDLDRDRQDMIVEHSIDLIATALGTVAPSTPVGSDCARALLLQRIKTFIDSHLCDPSLDAETIATAHGISVRQLHVLFKNEDRTVTRLIWERRLQRCANDLSDPGKNHLTITDICFRWGFNDAAHFSRSFRGRFGRSPSGYRAQR
ncbi:MAG: helix-turn-helix domain-containing protein [Caulobacterales bacterium]|nr:helix-turn-helix domain-containing protein [Caulobacterales bacterium]